MSLLETLQLIDLFTTFAVNRGIDMQAFMAARDKARSEGRSLTIDELKGFADTAQQAIDAI